MQDPTERFRLIFFEEASEAIDAIEQNLPLLQSSNGIKDVTDDIFRAAHSLKGGAATFGMSALTDFTHLMETLLDDVRSGTSSISDELVDCLFSSLDVLRNLLAHHQDNTPIEETMLQTVERELMLLIERQNTDVDAPEAAMIASKNWEIRFTPEHNIMHSGNDPIRYLKQCESLGELSVTCDDTKIPLWEDYQATHVYLSWKLMLSNAEKAIEKQLLDDVFLWIEDECDLQFEALPDLDEYATTARLDASELVTSDDASTTKLEINDTTSKSMSPKKSQTIRVDLEKIDSLINLLGELVITQSMLNVFGDADQSHDDERLKNGLSQLERHTRELQEGVMRIRMLPISFCFSRFPRVVRDMSKKLGKRVELSIVGEHTEVDKTVIEELTDPLVHLVRNSLDHGIEAPAVREKKGKSSNGMITLKAFHQVGNIIIEITDDGAGLNKDKIFAKAMSAGLIDSEREYTEQEIFDLIFLPGFSTAEEVSDISGRGVGMDVVRRNIRSLSGTIDVRSEANAGTTFTIRLPLTLAILDGQLVRIGEETYVIPLLSIIESIQVSSQQVNRVSDQEVTFKWRDEYIPLIKLGHQFGLQEVPEPVSEGLVVVVENEGKKCGLFVNELMTHQQVVVKSLEANYQQVDGISGATILGDGSVALILDIPSLLSQTRRLS